MKQSMLSLLLFASTLPMAGCLGAHRDLLKQFRPTEGDVCHQIIVTGTIYPGSTFESAKIGNTPAAGELRHVNEPYFPLPHVNNPLEVAVTIPRELRVGEGGPLTVKLGSTSPQVIGTQKTFSPPFVVAPAPAEVQITSFTAASPTIESGESGTVLSWSLSGPASQVTLNGEVVTGFSIHVNPTQTTTYTLTAYNSCIPSEAFLTLNVIPPLKLTLNPTSILLSPGAVSSPVAASIGPNNPYIVTISCPAQFGLTCDSTVIPPSWTSVNLK
jgi:hypothetical protein